MKWLLFVVGLLLIIGLIRNNPTVLPGSQIRNSPTPPPQIQGTEITYKGIRYIIYTQLVNPNKLSLIPNFTERNTTQRIILENNCKYGTNAGFYTPEQKPLGFFSTDSTAHAKNTAIVSNFLNGYVVKTNDTLLITDKLPSPSTIQFAFQSGPLFIPNQKLSIKNDESDRRVLLGKTEDGKTYFIPIVTADNSNSGPLLADVPYLLQQFNTSTTLSAESKTMKQFTLLINLDGGSASAFYGAQTTLQELVAVGSFLCEVE